jgi:selenocysteine lyase/cysteine desulfurase
VVNPPIKFDLARVRAETPSCSTSIHFDNAGASPSPNPVHERIVRHLELERRIGGYAAARAVEADLEDLYRVAAALIGANADEVAFVDSATRAWSLAFQAIKLQPGDRILTCRAEYASHSIVFAQVAKRLGIQVDIVPDDDAGQIDVSELKRRLDDRVKIVSLCHAPTNNGLLNPARAVGQALRGSKALFMLDACQSVGQIPIDVQEIGCHLLSATGRKFLRGPRGTGFLFVDRALLAELEPATLDIRGADIHGRDAYRIRKDARRFETWESAIAGRLGLTAAIRYAQDIGLQTIAEHVRSLADALRNSCASIPGVRVVDRGRVRTGIVALDLGGVSPFAARDALADQAIFTSAVASADAPYDAPAQKTDVLRASVHYFNTEAELAAFTAALARVAQELANRLQRRSVG